MNSVFKINANTIGNVNNIYEPTEKLHNEEVGAQVAVFKSFIGHATQEAGIGLILQEYIENSFENLSQCYLSRTDLLLGDRIADEILDVLANTRLHFVIFSPKSIQRHWLHLEAGAALVRRVPIVGVTHSGLTPADLPDPYRSYLAAEIDSPDGVKRLVQTLAQRSHVPPPTDIVVSRLFRRLHAACQDCRS